MNLTATKKHTRRREPAAQLAHTRETGLDATIVGRKSLREFHVTVAPLPGESIEHLLKRLHAFLTANNAMIVRQEIFGLRAVAPEFFKSAFALWRTMTWPVLWLEGEPVNGGHIAGLHVLAVSDTDVQWLFAGGRSVASVFSDGFARHCILSGISPSSELEARGEQADEVFDLVERQLARARMSWKNTARTWIYMDRILEWYDQFNLIRKDAFDRFEVYNQAMPASTGVGVSNLTGRALTVGAWAVAPLRNDVKVESVISPLQCSARDYGSSFSRAVEITTPDLRRLLISGTASISCDGATEHRGDIRAQIERTFEVVQAILESRSMRWRDVSRATAYLRDVKDAPALHEFLARNGYRFPLVITRADVCRNDLLFEIEVDALASTARSPRGNWEI